MYCRHCGVRLQQGMIICPECGTRQRRRASSVRCARCHSRVAVELSVCPRCGRDLKPAGPRWALWAGGLAALVLLGFWGMERLPVQPLGKQVSGTWGQLAALVQIPELPQSTPSRAQTSQPLGVVPSRTPAEFVLTVTVQATAAVTSTPALTPTIAATATLTEAIATVTPDLSYTVRAGDTLSGIGETTGVEWEVIAQLNGLTKYSSLQVGQKLLLPAPTPAPTETPLAPAGSPTPPAYASATASPTATAMATSTSTPTLTPTASPAPTATAAGVGTAFTYHVQPGDSLAIIGTRFGVPWETIAAANGLTARSMLQVGQSLIIPGADATPVPSSTPRLAATRAPSATATQPAPVYPAPILTMPGDNNPYSGGRVQVVFQWQPVPGLPADAQYQVEFRWRSGGAPDGTYTRVPASSTGTAVPGWIYLRADQPAREYTWWVHVVRVTTDGKGGEKVIELSPPSEVRTFYWN